MSAGDVTFTVFASQIKENAIYHLGIFANVRGEIPLNSFRVNS
jgi:hypothetical protein